MAGISYRIGDRDKQFSLGGELPAFCTFQRSAIPVQARVNKSFDNILPNLNWRKKISSKSSINVFYRGSVNAPSVNQLQDVINNNNPLLLSTGNPDLKQQYTHSLVTRFTFTNAQKGQSFFANLFLQKTKIILANATYIAASDSVLAPTITLYKGSQLTRPVNLDGYYSVRHFLLRGYR